MAYVLGFFAADGYITHNKRGADYWCIEIKDRDLLEKMKSVIGSGHKISIRRTGLYRLQVGSKEMCKDLERLGFGPDKTRSLAVPHVPAYYLRDFVRGYFDGDGCVWTGAGHTDRLKPSHDIRVIFTSCSAAFLTELRHRLRLHFILGGPLRRGNGDFCRLTYSSTSSLKMHGFMYNHPVLKSDSLFLQRKRKIFEDFISMRS